MWGEWHENAWQPAPFAKMGSKRDKLGEDRRGGVFVEAHGGIKEGTMTAQKPRTKPYWGGEKGKPERWGIFAIPGSRKTGVKTDGGQRGGALGTKNVSGRRFRGPSPYLEEKSGCILSIGKPAPGGKAPPRATGSFSQGATHKNRN